MSSQPPSKDQQTSTPQLLDVWNRLRPTLLPFVAGFALAVLALDLPLEISTPWGFLRSNPCQPVAQTLAPNQSDIQPR